MESVNDNIIRLNENEENTEKDSVLHKNLFKRLRNIKSNTQIQAEFDNGYATLIGRKVNLKEFDKMSNAFIDRINQYNKNDIISKFKVIDLKKEDPEAPITNEELSKIIMTSLSVSDNKNTFKYLEKELDITKNLKVELCNDIKPQSMLNHLIHCRYQRINEGNYLGNKLSYFIYLLKCYGIDITEETKNMFQDTEFVEIKVFEHILELTELEANDKLEDLKTALKKYKMTSEVYYNTRDLYLSEYKPLQDADVQWKLAQELLYLELFIINDKRMTPNFLSNKRKEHKKILMTTQKIPESLIINDFDYEVVNIKAVRNFFFGVNYQNNEKSTFKKGKRTRNFISLIIKALITLLRGIEPEDYAKKFIPITIKLTLAKFEWYNMPFIKAMYMVNSILLSNEDKYAKVGAILQEALKKLKTYQAGYHVYLNFIRVLQSNPDLYVQLRYIAILYPLLHKEYEKQDLKDLAYKIFTIFRLKNCPDSLICNMIFSSKVNQIMKPEEAFVIWSLCNDKPYKKLTAQNLRLAIGNEFRKNKKQAYIPLAIQVLRNQHFGIYLKWDCDILPKNVIRIAECDFDPKKPQKWTGSFENYDSNKKQDIININPSNLTNLGVPIRAPLIKTGVPTNIETRVVNKSDLGNNLSIIQEEPVQEKISRYRKNKINDSTFSVADNSLTNLVKKKKRTYSKIKYTK